MWLCGLRRPPNTVRYRKLCRRLYWWWVEVPSSWGVESRLQLQVIGGQCGVRALPQPRGGETRGDTGAARMLDAGCVERVYVPSECW